MTNTPSFSRLLTDPAVLAHPANRSFVDTLTHSGFAGFNINDTAFLAGLGTGVWSSTDELQETWQLDRRFEPSGDRERADAAHTRWRDAVERSKGWAD